MKLKIEKYIEDGEFKQKIKLTVFKKDFEADTLDIIIEKVKEKIQCSEKGCNNCKNLIYIIYETIDYLENDFVMKENLEFIERMESL